MKVTKEIELKYFEFWADAKDIAELMTYEELETIEKEIEGWQNEWTETDLNALFWFDSDLVVSLLGYEDTDEFLNERS